MKKILVTGASGYLGGKLVHALLNHNHTVRAFVRRASDLTSLPPPSPSLELAYGDVTDYDSLLAACSGCHVIFHVAALVEPWIPDPSRFITVNVGGLKNVIKACKEIGTVEKIVYTSSFFALGSTDGYVADETQIVKKRAMEVTEMWKASLDNGGGVDNVKVSEVHTFLHHLVTFGIAKYEDFDLYYKLVVGFAWRMQMPKLVVSLCVRYKELISRGHQADVVHFTQEVGLVNRRGIRFLRS